MGWIVDSLKTGVINGLAHTNLIDRNRSDDDTFLKKSETSPQKPSTIHCRDTLRDGPSGSHTAEKLKQETNNCNMPVVSVPGICCLLSDVMSSPVILSPNAFIQFKEIKEEKHSLILPARLAQTV